jgi:hypothetical protein
MILEVIALPSLRPPPSPLLQHNTSVPAPAAVAAAAAPETHRLQAELVEIKKDIEHCEQCTTK